MITTQHKAKLPRHLSYPVGAEALTVGLVDAPHVELFGVSFSDRPVWQHSEFQQMITLKQPYSILVAEYRPAQQPGYSGAQSSIESGWYDEKWQLTVYPVVRELRHLANGLLRERGLASLVEWLHTSRRAGWLSRKQRIELVFYPAEGTLLSQVSGGA